MKVKVSEATGKVLDWLVVQAEKRTDVVIRNKRLGIPGWAGGDYNGHSTWTGFYPTTDWAQGGPIIEREQIRLDFDVEALVWLADANQSISPWKGAGPTPLIAAMRCFVASKLGDEVDVPQELMS